MIISDCSFLTEDHSLFGLKENEIQPIKTSELVEGNFIAVPRSIEFENKPIVEINLFDYLNKFETSIPI